MTDRVLTVMLQAITIKPKQRQNISRGDCTSLSVHIFIKFPELCNRIPVERTAYPPLFTRHPPSDGYFVCDIS